MAIDREALCYGLATPRRHFRSQRSSRRARNAVAAPAPSPERNSCAPSTSPIVSRCPPAAEATTGTPAAIASSTESPSGSATAVASSTPARPAQRRHCRSSRGGSRHRSHPTRRAVRDPAARIHRRRLASTSPRQRGRSLPRAKAVSVSFSASSRCRTSTTRFSAAIDTPTPGHRSIRTPDGGARGVGDKLADRDFARDVPRYPRRGNTSSATRGAAGRCEVSRLTIGARWAAAPLRRPPRRLSCGRGRCQRARALTPIARLQQALHQAPNALHRRRHWHSLRIAANDTTSQPRAAVAAATSQT